MVRTSGAFCILTCKRASLHKGVPFFKISTSKSHMKLRCLVHFDLKMCFVPQWRTLFRHRNFQNCPRPTCLATFYFQMCFASQPNALFDISTSKSAPNMKCFDATVYFQMCFAPQRCAFFRHLNFQKWSEPSVF